MRKNKDRRGIFLVLRLPLLILLLLGFLLGAGCGGWHLYQRYRCADPAEAIRRGLQDHLASLESYHTRLKTVPVGPENGLAYLMEIWKESPGRYRIEMSTERGGRQMSHQLIVGDGEQVYLYDHGSADFVPATGTDEDEIELSGTFLEDYWRSISEASVFRYISEKKAARHSYYQIEVTPSEPHRYRVSERVWLEGDSFLPVRVESFDAAGRLTQVTVFELLRLNPALEAALFQVEDEPAAAPGGQ